MMFELEYLYSGKSTKFGLKNFQHWLKIFSFFFTHPGCGQGS